MVKSPEIATGNKTKEVKHLTRKALAIRLGGALLAVATIGVPAVKHHIDFDVPFSVPGIVSDFIPGIPQEYKMFFSKTRMDATINSEFKSAIISPTYDNHKDTQFVQGGVNTAPKTDMSLPTEDAIKPIEKGSFANETLGFPVKVKDGQKIKVETKVVKGVWNPVTEQHDEIGIPVGKILTIQDQGSEIIASIPADGLEVFKLSLPGENEFRAIAIQFFGPDGTRFVLKATAIDFGQMVTTDAIRNAPTVEPIDLIKNNPNVAKGKGTTVKTDDSILTTSVENAIIEFGLDIYSNKYARGTSYDFSFQTEGNKVLVTPQLSQ